MSRNAWIAVGGVSALAVALALALVIALASAGDDEPEEPRAPQILTPGGAASDEFQDCLSEQGVEPPEPGEQHGPPPGFEEALEVCREFLPDGGHGGPQIMPPG